MGKEQRLPTPPTAVARPPHTAAAAIGGGSANVNTAQLPPDASTVRVTSRQLAARTGCTHAFTLVFALPFRREHIYKELVSARQLGVDHTTVKISITKRTDKAEAALQSKLDAAAAKSRESACA